MTAPPKTYYEMLEERLSGHGEPTAELQSRGILLDGITEVGNPLHRIKEPIAFNVLFNFGESDCSCSFN